MGTVPLLWEAIALLMPWVGWFPVGDWGLRGWGGGVGMGRSLLPTGAVGPFLEPAEYPNCSGPRDHYDLLTSESYVGCSLPIDSSIWSDGGWGFYGQTGYKKVNRIKV